ncbi:MAG: hypothetical protein SGILL_006833, partial [Bacillariaceae sp.]
DAYLDMLGAINNTSTNKRARDHNNNGKSTVVHPSFFEFCIATALHPECEDDPNQQKHNKTELKHSTALESALQQLQSSDQDSNIVTLRIYHLWKYKLQNLRLRSKPKNKLVPWRESEYKVQRHFRFTNFLQSKADEALALMNIPTGQEYGVIHWRAEISDLDYLGCANDIAGVKYAMLKKHSGNKTMPFILMSSLSTDRENIWGPGRIKASSANVTHALAYLIQDQGFLKSDEYLPKQKDMIVYTAVDLLLAERAAAFSTCARDAECDGFCERCNHKGNFGQLAVGMRSGGFAPMDNSSDYSDGTLPCWPRPT